MKQGSGSDQKSGTPERSRDDAPLPYVLPLAPGTEAVAVADALGHLRHLTFLDSAMRHETLGRYSYVAADPFGRFLIENGQASWSAPDSGEATEVPAPLALNLLGQLLKRFATPHRGDLPPFQGGFAGFFAYTLGQVLEYRPRAAVPPAWSKPIPAAALHAYDVVVAFDHLAGKASIISTGWPETDPAARAVRARARAEAVNALIVNASPTTHPANAAVTRDAWRSNFTQADYEMAIAAVIDLILEGDIFQANIAQRFRAPLPTGFAAWPFYRRLRATNPAPFGAYIAGDGFTLASSSPERLLKLSGEHVEARPIKGTAARSNDPAEDARARSRLEASEKDRAENIMIVDLLRNDLSRVCRPHSVATPSVCGLETYASVHHLVSVVTGQLVAGHGIVELLGATFPGGSVTGAPKIRAMEIIAEIEREAREAYCGSIGFLGFNGEADLNILIRTVMLAEGEALVHAGGGITALSDPASEYAESLAKAERIFAAFAEPTASNDVDEAAP
ncbi:MULTISPECIES: anthranilate synthase component I family protein [unclassified Chelatococcus]|uniref:anthranilate synthase component I family protein n=1 Tax=unclassified Chelatococcus TaxID=2638111 RepID=UPI0025BEA541|nr:anthranilate synthase component I family protein [Chelatococcus sp.]